MTTANTTNAAAISAPLAGTPDQLTSGKMLQDNLLMLGLLFAIFYFVLIRPQQKRVQAHKNMLGALAKGNRVMTSGGLIGTIVKLDADIAVIEIAQGIKVRVAKSAITEVTNDKVNANDSANDN